MTEFHTFNNVYCYLFTCPFRDCEQHLEKCLISSEDVRNAAKIEHLNENCERYREYIRAENERRTQFILATTSDIKKGRCK